MSYSQRRLTAMSDLYNVCAHCKTTITGDWPRFSWKSNVMAIAFLATHQWLKIGKSYGGWNL